MMQIFKKTERQRLAAKVVQENMHSLLYGGSRSGKTFILAYGMTHRALKATSRHLITRKHFNHVKTSIWYDTFPKMMDLCFPSVAYEQNKSDWFFEFENGSQIWLGGIDDKQRTEKVLGNEYATIWANECSQISYDAIEMLSTRLAQRTALKNKFYYDCNPPSKKHWTHKIWRDGINPVDGTPIQEGYGSLQMNPLDNVENISEDYIEGTLKGLSKKAQQRFLLGEWVSDTNGALWTFDMVAAAQSKEITEIEETVVAIDPSVSNNNDSDLCGMCVASRMAGDEKGKSAVVQHDYSLKSSAYTWANAAVNAYHKHGASCIVAEVNQGGDLVEMAIHNIDKNIRVIKVHASKGKFSRAEPVAFLYEQGRIAHAEGLDELEGEMMEYVPITAKKSPDRLDAAVYALTHLLLKNEREPMFRVM